MVQCYISYNWSNKRYFKGKLCTFCKNFKCQSPCYLYELLLFKPSLITQDRLEICPFFYFKHNFFKTFFFPSENLSVFKKSILKFIRPSPKSTFNCFNAKGIKYLTRLRLGYIFTVSCTAQKNKVFQ